MLKKIVLSTCVVLGLATSLSVATDYALNAQTVEISPSGTLISAVHHDDIDPFLTAPVDTARIYAALAEQIAASSDAPALRFVDNAAAGGFTLGRFIMTANLLVAEMVTCGGGDPACDTRLKITGRVTPTIAGPSQDTDAGSDPLAEMASRESLLYQVMGTGGLGIGFSVDDHGSGLSFDLVSAQPNAGVFSTFGATGTPATAPRQTGSQRGARVMSTGQPATARLPAPPVTAPTISPVPVPASFALLIGGLAILVGLRAYGRRPLK